jgi:putative transposase
LLLPFVTMSRPRRLVRPEYVGRHQFTLTICTFGRALHFTRADTVQLVIGQILRTAVDEEFEVLTYCFMPDHVHLVVTGLSEASDLQRFVHRAKQKSGFAFARAVGERLWQESYFDRTIRSEESLPDIVKYIIENPLRAGLVATLQEYPHWGSQVYGREQLLAFIAACPV